MLGTIITANAIIHGIEIFASMFGLIGILILKIGWGD